MNRAVVYLIRGRTGEYADRSEWTVCWRATRREADEVRALCQEQATEYFIWKQQASPGERYGDADVLRRERLFDPWFHCDYTGTEYDVEEVCEDPREQYETMRQERHLAGTHRIGKYTSPVVEIAKLGRYCEWCNDSHCHGGCTQ